MLSSELSGRAKKLEKEQQQRIEKARQRLERERLLEARARQQRQALDDASRSRRTAALEAEEAVRLKNEEALEHNKGVWWRESLLVVPLDEEAIRQRGIKRGADKVVLPPSVRNELLRQDSPKNGSIFIELLSVQGISTHAGVLDFTAPEGQIMVPPQVAASLWPEGAIPNGASLTATYRRLEKGTFARLQPKTADFQQEVGEHMEAVLEAALSTRSTITEGDWLAVDFCGKHFLLRVQSLLPAPSVSVIDTEMEAEVEPSIETEQRLRREAEAAQVRNAQMAEMEAEAERQRQAQAEAVLLEAAKRERIRQEKEASLPSEPSEGEPSTVFLVKFPDGSRHSRKFRATDKLSMLFTFVDVKGAAGIQPGGYRLVTQFPRRVWTAAYEGTIADAGLATRQEMLLLEPTDAGTA